MKRQPSLFMGHGSPMNAVETNEFTQAHARLAVEHALQPRAILMVSAHWETEGTKVLTVEHPRTIHDFGGFPQALFDVRYPAPGDPALAQRVLDLLGPGAALPASDWGLDHGTWSPLVHLFPKANIPVVPLSLDVNKTPWEHLELSRKLRPLRDEGVMIMGSGNIVHNLRRIDWRSPTGASDWAVAFDHEIALALSERSDERLADFEVAYAEMARLSVPTPEHYLPLLYAYGASDAADELSFPVEGYQFGSLSMRSVLWTAK